MDAVLDIVSEGTSIGMMVGYQQVRETVIGRGLQGKRECESMGQSKIHLGGALITLAIIEVRNVQEDVWVLEKMAQTWKKMDAPNSQAQDRQVWLNGKALAVACFCMQCLNHQTIITHEVGVHVLATHTPSIKSWLIITLNQLSSTNTILFDSLNNKTLSISMLHLLGMYRR